MPKSHATYRFERPCSKSRFLFSRFASAATLACAATAFADAPAEDAGQEVLVSAGGLGGWACGCYLPLTALPYKS